MYHYSFPYCHIRLTFCLLNTIGFQILKISRFHSSLFGNEDIDYRKVAAPALVAPAPPSRDSPPPTRGVGWAGPPSKRPLLPSRGRGGMWPGRGRGRGPPIRDDVPWRDGEDSWEGALKFFHILLSQITRNIFLFLFCDPSKLTGWRNKIEKP